MGRPEDRDQEHGPPTPCDGEASEAQRPREPPARDSPWYDVPARASVPGGSTRRW